MTPLDVVVIRLGVSISIIDETSFRFSDTFPNRGPNRELGSGVDSRNDRVGKECDGMFAANFWNKPKVTLAICYM
jgi:hypothetical protein